VERSINHACPAATQPPAPTPLAELPPTIAT
jgi:hypothetical protein